jgi:S-DNA-T family DNA segregation ATPase FtsK/SpoIIIE
VFALADRPETQSQPTVAYDPHAQGNLLVCGAAGSGKSTAIAMLAAAASITATQDAGTSPALTSPALTSPALTPQCISRLPERAWDELRGVRDGLRAGDRQRLVLVDDLDAIVARLPDEYRTELVDIVLAIAREARAASSALVIAVQRPSPALGQVLALCDSRLLLRQATKADHLIAGGAGDQYDAELPPGGGFWRGDRVQVAVPSPGAGARDGSTGASPDESPVVVRPEDSPLLVVSRRPAALCARLRADRPESTVIALAVAGTDPRELLVGSELVVGTGTPAVTIVGDPTEWQSRWGAIDSLAATVPVFFDDCTASDFRSITRERELPPPVIDGTTGWLWSPATGVQRAILG